MVDIPHHFRHLPISNSHQLEAGTGSRALDLYRRQKNRLIDPCWVVSQDKGTPKSPLKNDLI